MKTGTLVLVWSLGRYGFVRYETADGYYGVKLVGESGVYEWHKGDVKAV